MADNAREILHLPGTLQVLWSPEAELAINNPSKPTRRSPVPVSCAMQFSKYILSMPMLLRFVVSHTPLTIVSQFPDGQPWVPIYTITVESTTSVMTQTSATTQTSLMDTSIPGLDQFESHHMASDLIILPSSSTSPSVSEETSGTLNIVLPTVLTKEGSEYWCPHNFWMPRGRLNQCNWGREQSRYWPKQSWTRSVIKWDELLIVIRHADRAGVVD